MGIDVIKALKVGAKKNASDIIITAGAPIAFRINGELVFVASDALSPADTKRMIYEMLSDDQIARFEARKELDFSMRAADTQRVRVNVYFQRGAVGAALRLIPDNIPTLEELGLPSIIESLCLKPQGLIVVAGPTGHGKSTTQASMVDIINARKRAHIITIEDPIEYVHHNKKSIVDQREVGDDTLEFKGALKHVLRQDPDVILIGEMRDLETIAAALTAAETGHLVITTLHTNDCVQSIDRILDVFPPHQQGQVRTQLAFALCAVISQRLLPRADKKGRVCACEILIRNDAVSNLIREGKAHHIYGVMETQTGIGMRTMDASLKELYLKGLMSYNEVKAHMKNPKVLERT